MDSAPVIRVLPDPAALADAAAEFILGAAREAVALRDRFTLALSGGGTPRATYGRLAAAPYDRAIPWERTFVFFGDERWVPLDDPQSNYRLARETLLSKVPVPASQVFPMRVGDDPELAARAYARTLAEVIGTSSTRPPRLDVVLLGVGPDGHTASLFPGSPALRESSRLAVSVHAPSTAAATAERVTLTLPVLNAAANVVFLASGAEKADVVRAVLRRHAPLPAGLVRPEAGSLVWLLDAPAAGVLQA